MGSSELDSGIWTANVSVATPPTIPVTSKKAESADDLRELCREQNITLQTLGRWQPTLLVELAPYVLEDRGSSLDEYLRILTSHGYRLLSESGLRPLPMQPDELVAMIGDDAVINAVARRS